MPLDRDSEEYHLQSIRLAFVREALGGVKAEDNSLYHRSMVALMEKGLTFDQIAEKAVPLIDSLYADKD